MVSRDPRRSGNPATRASGSAAGAAGGSRQVIGQRSRTVLVRMSRLPPLVVPGAMLVLMLVGLAAPLPYALAALGVIAVFVCWLAFISWPVLDLRGRLTRTLMIVVVLGSALGRITGWL